MAFTTYIGETLIGHALEGHGTANETQQIDFHDDKGAVRAVRIPTSALRLLLEVLTEILERLGYEAGRALNGNDAVQCYREALEQGRRYDLVIMDLTVPGGMGGREAMEELLKIDPEVLGIVSSGYSHDPVMERFMDYGFCARIAKPYRIEELSRVLTECLKKR